MQIHIHFLMGSRKRGIDFIIVSRLLPQVGINLQLCLQAGKRKALSITKLVLGKDQTLMNITELQSAVFAFLQCRQPSPDMAFSKVKVPLQKTLLSNSWGLERCVTSCECLLVPKRTAVCSSAPTRQLTAHFNSSSRASVPSSGFH